MDRDNRGGFINGNMSQELKDKISIGMKGKNTWMTGRKHSEETKKRLVNLKNGD